MPDRDDDDDDYEVDEDPAPDIEPRLAMKRPDPISGLLAKLLAEAEENYKQNGISDETAQARLAERDRETRIARLRPYGGMITREDFARIIDRKLDKKAGLTVRRFIAARKTKPNVRVLWLVGVKGSGKTVAALYALAELRGLCVSADELRRAYANEHDEAKNLRHRLKAANLLVVDDIGTSKDDRDEARALYEIVNKRQGGYLQTILTSNASEADVRKLDARLTARIDHVGTIIDCGQESFRRVPKPKDAASSRRA